MENRFLYKTNEEILNEIAESGREYRELVAYIEKGMEELGKTLLTYAIVENLSL